jgi:hypothetical protein
MRPTFASSPITRLLRAGSALSYASLVIGLSLVPLPSVQADALFDREWTAASSESSIVDQAYRPRLQAYFDSHSGYRDCDSNLDEGQGVRMLLRFDAAGAFRTTGELANDAVESCLASFFEASPPPRPDSFPLDLPFWFQ